MPVITKRVGAREIYLGAATTPEVEYETKETGSDFAITSDMKNIKIKNLIAGGGGGGGSYTKAQYQLLDGTNGTTATAPSSQADCPSYTKYVNGTCVAKWNLGDNGATESNRDDFRLGSDALPTTVYLNTLTLTYDTSQSPLTVYVQAAGVSGSCNAGSQSASTTDFTTGNKLCCWNSGVTSGGYETSSGTSTYSGGERTVCTWHAAVALCENWAPEGTSRGNWHLPTTSQLSVWSSNLATLNTNQGADGLQLCDYNSGYGAARCKAHASACVGAYGSYCSPRNVWSRSVYSSSSAYYRYLNSGSFNQNYSYPSYAFSARCLLEFKTTLLLSTFSGGSGASSGSLTNVEIEIPSACETSGTCSVVIQKGNGGTGGTSAKGTGSASAGSSGSSSIVYIKNISSGAIYWGIKILGANGGAAATDSTNGENGTVEAQNCSQYNVSTSSWVDLSCSTLAGNLGAAYNSGTIAAGGAGASDELESEDETPANGENGPIGDVLVQYDIPKT